MALGGLVLMIATLPLVARPEDDDEAKKLAQRVQYLGKLLKHTDPVTQTRAARSLRRMGVRARPAVPALTEALQDDDPGVRLEVIKALGLVSKENGVAVPALLGAVKEETGENQEAAFHALAIIGTQAHGAIPDLIAFLEDENLRGGALSVLERIGPAGREAVPALVATLGAAEAAHRQAAAHALGVIAAPDKPAAGEPWPEVTNTQTTAIQGLARTLGDNDADVRRVVALALAKFGPLAAPAVPDLIDALAREDPETHRHFAFVLGEIGPRAEDALPVLRQRLAVPDLMLTEAIELALKKIEK